MKNKRKRRIRSESERKGSAHKWKKNKIKAEHLKKFKLLCLRTCSHGVFEMKMAALMCSSTLSAYNMPKNISNHYTTKKGWKHKKLSIGSNEHIGEGWGTQKNVNFYIVRSQKTK